MNADQLKKEFISRYGGSAEEIRMFFAPGRVNLIGEHTDYNGGYVFPAALTFGTYLLIRKRASDTIRFASLNFPGEKEININQLQYDAADGWINYPKAVLHHLRLAGHDVKGGYDLLYYGNVPGSGLSSSASIQLATAYAIAQMENLEADRIELALISQKSENEFLGVQCGIMDQFTSAMGKNNHAVLLRCSDLAYEYVPLNIGEYRLLIANTNKSRGLVDSEYNVRRAQCEQAVKELQSAYPELKQLAELNAEQFAKAQANISDETVRKRAEHVIAENDRVLASVQALKEDDLALFGKYMNESHDSLRDLYEVSCKELDVLVDETRKHDGVLGSRMTGAGFGGCTVSLVHRSRIEEVIKRVGAAYAEQTDYEADFYVCDIGGGAREVMDVETE